MSRIDAAQTVTELLDRSVDFYEYDELEFVFEQDDQLTRQFSQEVAA